MLHLIVGPVGAGKSTYALRLAREHHAIHLNLDAWMACLFRPDRPAHDVLPWYRERVERCVAQIWSLSEQLVQVGTGVVLELGLIRRADREGFFAQVDAAGHALIIHQLDAPRALRRERVRGRNQQRGQTFSMEVPLDFFELASDLWEPLDDDERAGRDVRDIDTTR